MNQSENPEQGLNCRSSEKTSMEKRNGRRVILFPQPLQGCINPMLQLAKILYSRGFSIAVIHTRFNAPKASNHPLFTFFEISDGLSETQSQASSQDVMSLLVLLNRRCESPFRECLAKLLSSDDCDDKDRETNACLIDDSGWLFTHSVAESLNLPRIVLQPFKGSFFIGLTLLPDLRRKGYLPVADSEAESVVPEFPPLKKKDLSRILTADAEQLEPSLLTIIKATKASSGVIYMSSEELDDDSLNRAREVFRVPIFPIGPFHCYFPASSSSLFAQDETCIPWLDEQEDKSVIYVSFGSVATISESEFLEIAWGLSNSDQRFLWVIRPGLVRGSDWIEPLPKGFLESLDGRGKIVKWAPQQDVLGHRATGGFWTHSGWNSTLESICEGVPMICQPCGWDQTLNARFVSDVWRVGLHLEDRIERHEIEKAIRRLMVEPEGEELQERVKALKDRIRESVREGGSSYQSLEDLVDRISSL